MTDIIWLKDLFLILLSSLGGFAISKIIKENFGKDYSAILTYGLVFIISAVPLVIVVFFDSNFQTSFYIWYQSFSTRYLFDCIAGVIFHPLWNMFITEGSNNSDEEEIET